MPAEIYQGYEIVLRPEPRTGSASGVSAVATPRRDGRDFVATVKVTDSAAGSLGVSGDEKAHELAAQLAHGIIDIDAVPKTGRVELEISSYWVPGADDGDFSDSALKDLLLRAAFRMHRVQTLESQVLEIDVDGIALALHVDADRLRGIVGDLLAVGIVEAYAESFGRTAVDGRFRITGEGIQYLAALDEVLEQPASSNSPQGIWPDLEVRIAGLGAVLDAAESLDDFQDVGRRCREIAIDAANAVFSDSMVPEGETVPRRDDAKARIDYILSHCAAGGGYDELRRFVRATWALSQATTHSRNADLLMASTSAQATLMLVRTLEGLYGSCSWHVDVTFSWQGDEGGNTRYSASWTESGGFGDIQAEIPGIHDADTVPPVSDAIEVIHVPGRTLRFEFSEPLAPVLVELVASDGTRTRPSATGSGGEIGFAEFRSSDVPS